MGRTKLFLIRKCNGSFFFFARKKGALFIVTNNIVIMIFETSEQDLERRWEHAHVRPHNASF